MRRYQITLLSAALVAAVVGSASAQESAAFLKIGYGARGVALGNTYTALTDDSDALYWNPGALALTGRPEVGMTRAQMFLGDTYDAVSLAVPLGYGTKTVRESLGYRRTAMSVYKRPSPRGVLGFGFARLGHSAQQGRDINRQQTGDFDAADMALTVAYSRPLLRGMYAGASLKRIQSRIADRSAGTVAADFGMVHHFGGQRSWRLGAAVRNVGPGLKFESQASPLPLNFAFGAGFEALPGLLLASELQVRPHAHKAVLSFGTEYALMPMLSLRAGYLQESIAGAGGGDALGGFGGGIGLKWGRFLMDYSVAPYGIMGNLQRISLRAKF